MNSLKQYIVDAFTDKVFKGNPAAVCILDKWLDDNTMLNIAKENNLSETAFAVKNNADNDYNLRWFTPSAEIDLCGHATLATSYVFMNIINKQLDKVYFHTKGGDLIVERKADRKDDKKYDEKDDLYEMDFPAYDLEKVEINDSLKNIVKEAIGFKPIDAFIARDLVCVFENEEEIFKANPNADKIKELEGLIFHITAKGKEYDCVSRSFAPKLNILEDPVCGSGHCHIIPLWAHKLNKNNIVAYQASKRSGVLYCNMMKDRVKLAGKAALYSSADIYIS